MRLWRRDRHADANEDAYTCFHAEPELRANIRAAANSDPARRAEPHIATSQDVRSIGNPYDYSCG
jgi:hypothetical protein